MKKNATQAGSGQEAKSDLNLPAPPARRTRARTRKQPATPSDSNLTPEHRQHLIDELGEGGAVKAEKHGARSLTLEQATARGFGLLGKDGKHQRTSGLLLPYEGEFAQLRCDNPPTNKEGETCKYLNLAGRDAQIAVFGGDSPVIATEGWKDALSIHMATGEPTAAVAGVHGWKKLPASVERIIYDADAAINPQVWSQLIKAGQRLKARVGFFPRSIAGDKGGACEFFRNGGKWKDISFKKPSQLLREIHLGWDKNQRADFQEPNLRHLLRRAAALDFPSSTSEQLFRQASRQLGIGASLRDEIFNRFKSAKRKVQTSTPPEPEETHPRVQELAKQLGPWWRADYETTSAWLQWMGTHWVSVGTNDYFNRALEHAYDDLGWEKRDAKTVRDDREGVRRAIGNDLADCRSDLIYFRNGALRLNDKKLIPHDPVHGNRYCLPFDWEGEDAIPKKTLDFLLDRFGDEGSVMMFFCFLRALLTGEQAKVIFQLVGQGDTGKSVVAAIPHALVGIENCKAGNLHLLEHPNRPFETFGYRGKRLAIFNEAAGYSGSLEKLKALTGRDTITAERKGSVSQVDFQFTGGVLIVGNRAIRVSETSDAIFNRLRTIYLDKPVPTHKQKTMLERDGGAGWKGELASELPAIAAYALKVTTDQQRHYLSRDLASLHRVESDLRTLLESDHLAAWANDRLVWDEHACSQVGDLRHDPEKQNIGWLLPDYHQWVRNTEPNARAHGIQAFKPKLLSLLRDSMKLPLPPDGSSDYRRRGAGSVIPHIRLRRETEPSTTKGILSYGLLKRIGMDPEQIGNGETPVGNGWNGSEASTDSIKREQMDSVDMPEDHSPTSTKRTASNTVPLIPSVPQRGSQDSGAVPQQSRIVPRGTPIEVQDLRTGEWECGWWQIGGGKGSASALCRDPQGQSRLIGKKQIRLSVEVA
jgi:phage/plasmid-associated DNA primase